MYSAALREFEEELGVIPETLHHCGELSTQYVFASGNRVHPVVTIIKRPRSSWKPDPIEVEEVVSLPLRVLLDTASRTEVVREQSVMLDGSEVGKVTLRGRAIRFQDHVIWGGTALILEQLARVLRQLE